MSALCRVTWRRMATAAAGGLRRPVFLDAQSTTPMDPRVLDAMLPYQLHLFGNPHSRTHQYGWEAEAVKKRTRALCSTGCLSPPVPAGGRGCARAGG